MNRAGTVIVGMDGSDCAHTALRWALANSATLGEVTPVSSYQLPTTVDLLGASSAMDRSALRAAAEERLGKIVAATDPTLAERAQVVEAHPGIGLVQAAADADALVVGTRGRRGITAALLGSVSSYCVSHATVPVIVVPPHTPIDRPIKTIAVGVDGSDNSLAALQWAIEHAPPDGTVLAAGAGSVYGYLTGAVDPSPEVMQRQIQEMVEASIAEIEPPVAGGPEVVIVADPGDARAVLPRMAADYEADLLVLGARGTSGVPYLILGSVSMALAHHPQLPTVIVPGPGRPGPGR